MQAKHDFALMKGQEDKQADRRLPSPRSCGDKRCGHYIIEEHSVSSHLGKCYRTPECSITLCHSIFEPSDHTA
jgi:hypothetical protein